MATGSTHNTPIFAQVAFSFPFLPLLLFKEQLKFHPFMEIRDVGTVSQIPQGGFRLWLQYLHLPVFSQKPFSMLHPGLHSQPAQQTTTKSTTTKRREGAASKINRVVLNIQGHEIFIQHHLFGVHAERLAPGIEFIEVKSECVSVCPRGGLITSPNYLWRCPSRPELGPPL